MSKGGRTGRGSSKVRKVIRDQERADEVWDRVTGKLLSDPLTVGLASDAYEANRRLLLGGKLSKQDRSPADVRVKREAKRYRPKAGQKGVRVLTGEDAARRLAELRGES